MHTTIWLFIIWCCIEFASLSSWNTHTWSCMDKYWLWDIRWSTNSWSVNSSDLENICFSFFQFFDLDIITKWSFKWKNNSRKVLKNFNLLFYFFKRHQTMLNEPVLPINPFINHYIPPESKAYIICSVNWWVSVCVCVCMCGGGVRSAYTSMEAKDSCHHIDDIL